MIKSSEPSSVFRHRAEDRGYQIEPLDEHGGTPELTGRGVAGVVLRSGDGDAVWIPADDVAVVGDLLIRTYVQIAHRKG